MDKINRHSTRYNVFYTDDIHAYLRTPSTADKIQDIRQQLEDVLASAYNKRTKKTNNFTTFINSEPGSSSFSARESRSGTIIDNPFQNDSVIPVEARLLAYKKFISSLTRIVKDAKQPKSNSLSLLTNSKVQNPDLRNQNRSIEEKGTFLIERNRLPETCYGNYVVHGPERAEKTTYCRPVTYNHEFLSKTLEKNAKLQLLVKKLVKVREKEKQHEAWNNYINELKNKHGQYGIQSETIPKIYEEEQDKRFNVIDDSYNIRHSWNEAHINTDRNFCENRFDEMYKAPNNVSDENITKRRTWCVPSTSKPYKYVNNSFCCPMSSQGRLMMIKKEREKRIPGYTLRAPGRYYRGTPIVVDKQSLGRMKLRKRTKGTMKSQERIISNIWECRAVQTSESCGVDVKNNQMLDTILKQEKVSNRVENLKLNSSKVNLFRDDVKKKPLLNIENKLDSLIKSFNKFLKENQSKKGNPSVMSEAVSCSSMSRILDMLQAKSDTYSYNGLTKHNILCEAAHDTQHSSLMFPSRPISQGLIDEILNEEKDKSDKAKEDINNILNNKCQKMQLTLDIPTKDNSTEVSKSFNSRQLEEMVIEEIEPTEENKQTFEDKPLMIKRSLKGIERSMTIAVNTDPMGILALIRVSAETVKQILSYVPNLDYVTYLARRQLDNSGSVARYVCNICRASFSRPSALNDHIQQHNIPNTKNCCVCRHVLDRMSHRSGLFTCAHCGQMFTRAYCCELHEQTCSMANNRRTRPGLIPLT